MRPSSKPRCIFGGCGRPVAARGLCHGHYQQARRICGGFLPSSSLAFRSLVHSLRPLVRAPRVAVSVRLSGAAYDVLRKLAKRTRRTPYAWASEHLESHLKSLTSNV